MDSGILIDAIEIEGDLDKKVCGCLTLCVAAVGQASLELVVE